MHTLPIHWVGMTRQHYQAGRPGPIRAVVVHSTAGTHPGDLAWLRAGGDVRRPVSCHYYIDKAGRISQLVRDEDTAWHAGRSSWQIDGQQVVDGLNGVSLGIELANRNSGRDPYPEAQVASLAGLIGALAARYSIPRGQVVRHCDISPGRKTDPAGLDWPSVVAQALPPPDPYDAESPLLGPTRATLPQAVAHVLARPHGAYTARDLASVILPAYWRQAGELGIPAELALAQAIHETGNFSSYWAARPRRNPAGIGVTGEPGAGCAFASWERESIPAQLGRLLAYALAEGQGTPAQAAAIAYALAVRPLPAAARGTCAALRLLGRVYNPSGHGWASPGHAYGAAIARIANAIRSAP